MPMITHVTYNVFKNVFDFYLFIYEDIGVLGLEKKVVVHDRCLKAEIWRTEAGLKYMISCWKIRFKFLVVHK